MISPIQPEHHSSVAGAIRRQSHKALAVLAFCILGAVAYTAISPVYYGSEAKIFVRLGRESVELDPTATTGQTVSIQDARENEINSVFETLTSRAILEGVIDEISPDVILNSGGSFSNADHNSDGVLSSVRAQNETNDSIAEAHIGPTMLQKLNPLTTYSRRDSAVRTLAKKLSVTNAKKSNIITIFCEGQTPEVAQRIVARVIELARDTHTRVNRIAGSLNFFTEQTDAERRKLAELESQLCKLKNESGVASLEQQREIQLKQIGSLDDELQATVRALGAAEAETRSVQQRLSAQSATVVTAETTGMADTAAARMREQLYALQIREQELASKLTDEHPQLIQIKAQIAQDQATLDREKLVPEITKGENKTYKDLEMTVYHSEASVESLRTKQRLLTDQLAQARAGLKSINDAERELGGLERDIDVSRQNYRRYADNLEQARIDQELASERISNINILQQPTLSYTPVGPRAMFNLTIGLGLGLIAAVGVVALGEQRRREQLDRNATAYHRTIAARGGDGVSRTVNSAIEADSQYDGSLAKMGFGEVPNASGNRHWPHGSNDDRNIDGEGNGRFSLDS